MTEAISLGLFVLFMVAYVIVLAARLYRAFRDQDG